MERSEAIEIVREHYPSSGKDLNEALETLIPELKESEDERIRSSLIRLLQVGGYMSPEDKDKAFAWLAKQGSQNLANSAKTCKIEQKPTLPGFEEQEGVAGRDYIPVEWVEAIENYGKWKIVRVNILGNTLTDRDMTRAEEQALKAYPKMSRITEPKGTLIGDGNAEKREGFVEGYNQASKDYTEYAQLWVNSGEVNIKSFKQFLKDRGYD